MKHIDYFKELTCSSFFKHYPGQHDQASHGNRYGHAGQSNGLAQFDEKPGDDYHEKNSKAYARDQFMRQQYKDWQNGLSKKEASAINYYSGNGYSNINGPLRQGEKLSTYIKGKVNGLDSALEKGEAPFAFTVKRGMSLYGPKAEAFISEMEKNVGKTFTDAGFISTSVKHGFSGSLSFTIHVPKGAKGAYIADLSQHSSEHEFLLPRNAKFKIISVKKDTYGSTQIEMGYIKAGKAKKGGS